MAFHGFDVLLHAFAVGRTVGGGLAVGDAFEGDGLAVELQLAVFHLDTPEAEAGADGLLLLHVLVAQSDDGGVEHRSLGIPRLHTGPGTAEVDGLFAATVEDHPAPHAVEGVPLGVPKLHFEVVLALALAAEEVGCERKGAASGGGIVVGYQRVVAHIGVVLEKKIGISVEAYRLALGFKEGLTRLREGFDDERVGPSVAQSGVEKALVPVA